MARKKENSGKSGILERGPISAILALFGKKLAIEEKKKKGSKP